MQSTFAEEIEQGQQLPQSADGPPQTPISLLPKAVAAGPLLGNAVAEDSGEAASDSSAIVNHTAFDAAPTEAAAAVPMPLEQTAAGLEGNDAQLEPDRSDQQNAADGSSPPRIWSPRIRVSDAVRASVRTFSETARGSSSPTAASEAEASQSAPKSSPAISRGKAVALGMLGAALVLALTAVVFLVAQEADSGFLSIDLPADLKGKNISVVFRGEPLQIPEQGKLLHKAKAGGGVLMIQAEGYQTFSQNAEIKGAREVTEVPAKLAPLVRSAQLAVVTDPEDAEVRVNGSVVASGGASAIYLAEIPVGAERLVQVRRAGYISLESRVRASKAGEQVKIHAKLQPLDYSVRIQSSPRGAIVWANGERLGRTPLDVQLTAAVSELTLSKRCYQPAQVPISMTEASEPEPINVSLKRLPSCR